MNYLNPIFQRLPFLLSLIISLTVHQSGFAQTFHELTPIADAEGFAAPYVGVSNGSLIVAGGANFPHQPRWETEKVWYDSIYILDSPNGQWRKSTSKLPRPLAYGLSFNLSQADSSLARDIPHGVLCIGGGDSKEHVTDCFVLSLKGNRVKTTAMPSLPAPLANGTGVLHRGSVYVLGGLHAPDATRPAKVFLRLDLSKPIAHREWEKLTTWPGAPRMLAVAGVVDNSIYLFSGTDLVLDQDAKITRKYLTDGFKFDLNKNRWTQTASLPRPAVAAPTPAIKFNHSLLVVSGDHGEYAAQTDTLKDKHPGFPASVLSYYPNENTWKEVRPFPKAIGEAPETNPHTGVWPPVVTNVTNWQGHAVIACGEVRPRVRSRRVFIIKP